MARSGPARRSNGTSPAPGTSHRASRRIARASSCPCRASSRFSVSSVPSSCSAHRRVVALLFGRRPVRALAQQDRQERLERIDGRLRRLRHAAGGQTRRQADRRRARPRPARRRTGTRGGDRADELRRLRPVAERPADRSHGLAQGAVRHHHVSPDTIEDLVSRDGPVPFVHEQDQQVEVTGDQRGPAGRPRAGRAWAGDSTNLSKR